MALYARPEDVHSKCDHLADPPIVRCTHDWRIHWGNVDRQVTGEGG